jgi:hypothetical protein
MDMGFIHLRVIYINTERKDYCFPENRCCDSDYILEEVI